MVPDLKQKLHKLIDNCNDEFLLEEARAVLESPQTAGEFFDEFHFFPGMPHQARTPKIKHQTISEYF